MVQVERLPGGELQTEKMPGHWVLARLGKKVLRPGGVELTNAMLAALPVGPGARVVEFAPGLGYTAQLTLARYPTSYTAVEPDEAAADLVRKYLRGNGQRCVVGRAESTGLPDGLATVVYGEAMLSMQTETRKKQIVAEAYRVLSPGGSYGIHELMLAPDEIPDVLKNEIQSALSNAIHVGARPMTIAEWRGLLEEQGFIVTAEATAPMHLLEPKRIIDDEGVLGALRLARNILADHAARERVQGMRRIFRQYEAHLGAIMLVARKAG